MVSVLFREKARVAVRIYGSSGKRVLGCVQRINFENEECSSLKGR